MRRAAEHSGVRVVEQHARPGADLVRVASLAAMLDLATAYLATDAARLITGQTLYIDGGYNIMG